MRARHIFEELLLRPTTEHDWQRFFTQNPFVLSRSLPLRLASTDILPLGRPGYSEPDFLFYSRDRDPAPYYGVIELKRPDTPIAMRRRKTLAVFSREAETALRQAQQYGSSIAKFAPVPLPDMPIFLGSEHHSFVILGLAGELAQRVERELLVDLVEHRMPPSVGLLPFDTLLRLFEAGLPHPIHVLVPHLPNPARRRALETSALDKWHRVRAIVLAFIHRNREAFRRSSHGIAPEWIMAYLLPIEFREFADTQLDFAKKITRLDDLSLARLDAALDDALARAIHYEPGGQSDSTWAR